MSEPMKTCTKCGDTKPHGDYHKNRRMRDGLTTQCKACQREYARQYRAANAERRREYDRQWRAANPDRKREHNRQYYAANAERYRERVRQWQTENPERAAAYAARRRERKYGALTDYDRELSAAYRLAIVNDPCYYCGTHDAEQYHVDHYFPLAKGGDDRWYNLHRACATCNCSKHATCGTAFMLRKGTS